MSKFNLKFLLKTKNADTGTIRPASITDVATFFKNATNTDILYDIIVCFQAIKILTEVVANFYLEQSIQEWIN